MVSSVRRIRWLIALLLLLTGQAGGVSASVASACLRAPSPTPAAGDPPVVIVGGSMADVDDAAEPPAVPTPSVPGPAAAPGVCGSAAVPVAPTTADTAPLVRIHHPLPPVDAALPRLIANSLFRPPRLS